MNKQQQNNNAGTIGMAGMLGASALSGAGGTTVTQCGPNDTSFYCKATRGFNLLKMVLFIIALLAVAYFLYKALKK